MRFFALENFRFIYFAARNYHNFVSMLLLVSVYRVKCKASKRLFYLSVELNFFFLIHLSRSLWKYFIQTGFVWFCVWMTNVLLASENYCSKLTNWGSEREFLSHHVVFVFTQNKRYHFNICNQRQRPTSKLNQKFSLWLLNAS